MDSLIEKIKSEGRLLDGDILKVDSFLNHQIDVSFMKEIGAEFYRLFSDCGVNKILTVEASGIGIACITAQFFNCNAVFAKKSKSANIGDDVYTSVAHSYTYNRDNVITVSKSFLSPKDNLLVVDDFLARGAALTALIDIAEKSGAKLSGVGIVIEKAYQGGGDALRARGVRIESLAKILRMNKEEGIVFSA